jgi:hypothetical protein
MVAGQNAALGRSHAGQTVTVLVSDTTLAIEFTDGDVRGHLPRHNPAGA